MILVDVYIEDPFLNNKVLTYHSDAFIESGVRVFVMVKTSKRIGFVKQSYEGEVEFETRPILEVIDQSPIVGHELLELGQWMAKTTLNPIIRCFQAILPNQLRPSSSFLKKQEVTMLRLVDPLLASTSKQITCVERLKESDMTLTEANKEFKSIVKTLEDKGAIERYQLLKTYKPKKIEIRESEIELTKDQRNVLSQIDLNSQDTYLLFGVTGSGKTEIYLQTAADVLKNEQQVLILVPEISLTPQMIDRFQKRFGMDVGIYHSGLNPQEKYEQYLRVQKREVSIVVGTRSAVFLPFENLGLIVMDEEHDDSFKQDSSPYYHAREIARFRQKYHKCPLLLGSASPSLDSFARAYKGHYKLLELNHRINDSLPKVHIINTQRQLRQLNYQELSVQLIEALKERLQKGEQSLLLLNRRSYSPILRCSNCGETLMCPNCDTTLSFHKADRSYRCHTCDYSTKNLSCSHCGHRGIMEMKGMGTQRLQEIVGRLIPEARILRMDRDTTTKKNSHYQMLKDFSDHKYDILIGTQMIAKGLDIPKVTCVGIINPDSALMHEDFSSSERAFSLILQASGRAGRAELLGDVYLQTYNPDHYAIKMALRQDYKQFFNLEMKYRHMGQYPPYTYLIEIIFTHTDEDRLFTIANTYQVDLKKSGDYTVLGPALIRKIKKLNRMRIILKGKDIDGMRENLYQIHEMRFKELKGVRVSINVNPQYLAT